MPLLPVGFLHHASRLGAGQRHLGDPISRPRFGSDAASPSAEDASPGYGRRISASHEQALVARLREGDQEAWLELHQAYLPFARYLARLNQNRHGLDVEEVGNACEFGLAMAIEEVKKEEVKQPESAEETFLKRITRHANRALNEARGKNPLGSSLNAPMASDSDTTFAALLAEDTLSPDEQAAQDKKIRMVLQALPCLTFMEEAVVILGFGLNTRVPLPPEEIGQRLGVSADTVRKYTDAGLDKMTQIYRWKASKRNRGDQASVPIKRVNALAKLVEDKRAIRPLVQRHWDAFTEAEQATLRRLVFIQMSPEHAAQELKIPEERQYRHAVDILSKLRQLVGVEAPVTDASQEDAEFLNNLIRLTGLTKLRPQHLDCLTLQERTLLRLSVGEVASDEEVADTLSIPLDAVAKGRDEAIVKLKQHLQKGSTGFRATRQSVTAGLDQVLDDHHVDILAQQWEEGQSAQAIAEASGGLKRSTITGRIQHAVKALRESRELPAAAVKEALEVPVTDDRLAQALVKEGIQGLTPRMLQTQLTENQRQVLRLRLKGWSYADIARHLERTEAPIKSTVARALAKLRKVAQANDILTPLHQHGLTQIRSEDLAPLSPRHQQLLGLYFAKGHHLRRFVNEMQAVSGADTVKQLETRLSAAVEALPPQQKSYLTLRCDSEKSFSELARDLNTGLSQVTQAVYAGLVNVEKSMNPVTLVSQLQDEGFVALDEVSLNAISEPHQAFLRAYLNEGFSLAGVVHRLPKGASGKTLAIGLAQEIAAGFEKVPPRSLDIALHYWTHDCQDGAVTQKYGLTASGRRDHVGKALSILVPALGDVSLEQRLKRFGLDVGASTLGLLSEKERGILEAYLRQGHGLETLAANLAGFPKGTVYGQRFVDEIQAAMGAMTDKQQQAMDVYRQNGFRMQASAKALAVNFHSVRALLAKGCVNMAQVFSQGSLAMKLHHQGFAHIRPEALKALPEETGRLLRLYLDKGYSLALVAKPVQGNEAQFVPAIQSALKGALAGLRSEPQRQALSHYCSGDLSYADVAEKMGLGRDAKDPAGMLIQAGLKMMRRSLEGEHLSEGTDRP